ncbi:hypothetical protein ACVWY5_000084 [Bradyrhizobium sp. USDA 3256]
MCRSTDAPSSWVCLFDSLLGVAVATPARRLIFDEVIGCTVLKGEVDGGFLAIWHSPTGLNESSEYTFSGAQSAVIPQRPATTGTGKSQYGVGNSTASVLGRKTRCSLSHQTLGLPAPSTVTYCGTLLTAPRHSPAVQSSALITKRVTQGVAECKRALALYHNLADAHEMMGIAKSCMGCSAGTESHVNEAFTIDPSLKGPSVLAVGRLFASSHKLIPRQIPKAPFARMAGKAAILISKAVESRANLKSS